MGSCPTLSSNIYTMQPEQYSLGRQVEANTCGMRIKLCGRHVTWPAWPTRGKTTVLVPRIRSSKRKRTPMERIMSTLACGTSLPCLKRLPRFRLGVFAVSRSSGSSGGTRRYNHIKYEPNRTRHSLPRHGSTFDIKNCMFQLPPKVLDELKV